MRNSPLPASSTPATTFRACTSNPTHVPSAIPAPPVIAALPLGPSRRQPAPTYERGAGSGSIWSRPPTLQASIFGAWSSRRFRVRDVWSSAARAVPVSEPADGLDCAPPLDSELASQVADRQPELLA